MYIHNLIKMLRTSTVLTLYNHQSRLNILHSQLMNITNFKLKCKKCSWIFLSLNFIKSQIILLLINIAE